MVFTFFSLIIFFGILFFFGWQLSRLVLSEKRIEALIPLAAIVGSTFYLFSLNLLSYLIDIKINFYLLLAVFLVLSYFLFRANRKKAALTGAVEWGIDKKWRRILFATCFLIVVINGIMGIRYVKSDEMFYTHLPLAATVAEGNFPPSLVFAPNFPEQYHYGYILSSAAISKITNLPIWFSYDFHNAVFIGVIFLIGFLLIRDFLKDNFKAYLASLLMIFGGGLNFLYGINGLFSLYQKYVLNLQVAAPFKFLNDMIFGKDGEGGLLIANSQNPWMMLGFALTIAVIYLYFRAINSGHNWFKISLLAGIIFSFLALSAEIFFGVLGIVFLIYPLIFRSPIILKTSFLILFLGVFFASFQGGIVTQTIKQNLFGYSFPGDFYLSINPGYFLKGLIPVDSLTFFLRWGWLIIFIVPAATYFLKKHFQLASFLMLIVFISIFLSSVVTAPADVDVNIEVHGAFARVSFLGSIFWNLIFGLFLGWLLLSFKNSRQRLLIIILILGVTFQGLLYFVLFSIFPGLEMGRSFLGEPAKLNSAELEAINWAKSNTTIKDYFLTFWKKSLVPASHDFDSEFIVYTGRFAPSFLYSVDLQPGSANKPWQDFAKTFIPERVRYQRILKECDPASLGTLNYSYLYVNENWLEGLEAKCLANNDLELVFQSGNNKIYKIK